MRATAFFFLTLLGTLHLSAQCDPVIYHPHLLSNWQSGAPFDECIDLDENGSFNLLDLVHSQEQLVTYELIIDVTWSADTHPDPAEWELVNDPHLSWLGGIAHNDQVAFWNLGEMASPGMIEMQERGGIDPLGEEAAVEILDGTTYQFYPFKQHFSAPSISSVRFGISPEYPLVTFVTMIGPSGDWFVGTNGLSLWENGQWVDEVVHVLNVYDGGTRSHNELMMQGPFQVPPNPIMILDWVNFGLIPAGTFTFRRVQ